MHFGHFYGIFCSIKPGSSYNIEEEKINKIQIKEEHNTFNFDQI